jgi:Josephin
MRDMQVFAGCTAVCDMQVLAGCAAACAVLVASKVWYMQVLSKALQDHKLDVIPISNPQMQGVAKEPQNEEAFICNSEVAAAEGDLQFCIHIGLVLEECAFVFKEC